MNAKEAREKAMFGGAEKAIQIVRQVEGYIARAIANGDLRTTMEVTAFHRYDVDTVLGILATQGFEAREVQDGRNGSYLEISWR